METGRTRPGGGLAATLEAILAGYRYLGRRVWHVEHLGSPEVRE